MNTNSHTVRSFDRKVEQFTGEDLNSHNIEILQVNLGLKCNNECSHCHLEASPLRTETMQWPIMEEILNLAGRFKLNLIDLTGGAPELNPNFRRLVATLTENGHQVQVRTNLTVFFEPNMETLPEFFKTHKVKLVASLPCYTEENVRAQRGVGIYEKSIEAMRLLNTQGYGIDDELQLNLIYNPGGPSLPGPQSSLEADYHRELKERFGVVFTGLFTITNMPLGRFQTGLKKEEREEDYINLLINSFNPETLDGLMCRHQVSVGWDGSLYDCDFNLALGLNVNHGAPDHITVLDDSAIYRLNNRRIVTGDHCFGCTAGAGSSCAGALI
jgi:radical SAM/Cys-rich protein